MSDALKPGDLVAMPPRSMQITVDELAAVAPEGPPLGDGRALASDASDAEDLATFLDEQTRRIVGTYGGRGRCTASSAEEEDE